MARVWAGLRLKINSFLVGQGMRRRVAQRQEKSQIALQVMHAPGERQRLSEKKSTRAGGESDSSRNAGQPSQQRGAQGPVRHDGKIEAAGLERSRQAP